MSKGERFHSEEELKRWEDKINPTYSFSGIPVGGKKYKLSLDGNRSLTRLFILDGGSTWSSWEMHNVHPSNYINFDYQFSVSKKRKDDFFKIANEFISYGFSNKHIGEIIDTDLFKYLYTYEESEHKILNNDFLRFKFKFKNLKEAIYTTTIIEDAISFISMIWGYTESGEEKCLIKYPIGSIVNQVKERGVDFMVDKYNYIRPNSYISEYGKNKLTEPVITYDLVCLTSDLSSSIIKYGHTITLNEEQICPSRTNKIDIILN